MRYLVTGGNGFIGSHLVRRLAERAKTIVLVQPGSALARPEGLASRVQYVTADIRDASVVLDAMTRARPTAVCHLAAGGVTPGSSPSDVVATNVLGTYHVLAAIRKTPSVRRAVIAGSWFEYGSALAADAGHGPEPTTPYGISKLAATLLTLDFERRFSVPTLVVRPFQVYGPGEPPHRIIPLALRCAASGEPVPLRNPLARRDWVFVDDVAMAIEAALDSDASGTVVDIGTGLSTTVSEVVARALTLAGHTDCQVASQEPSPSEDNRLSGTADIRPARELLSWTAATDLDTGLRKTIEWHRLGQGAPASR